MEKSITSTKSSAQSEQSQNDKFVTVPHANNLQSSIEFMTEEQIFYNLIELNLVSIYNEHILDFLYRQSTKTKFYLHNRYILQNIMNVNQHEHNQHKKVNKHKKSASSIIGKYDSIYVNGANNQMKKEQYLMKQNLFKEVRARFISERQEFVDFLTELSQLLKDKQSEYDEEELRHYFQSQIDILNKCQLHNTISNKKLQKLRNQDSFSSNEDALSEVSSVDQSPNKNQSQTLFTMCFNNQIHFVKEINSSKSGYIRTKNRYPLILDFGFSRFIFKNDNQLGHQIIAMHLLRYINKIISMKMKNQQIIEYQIIPENKGAFYQFMENSKTVSNIKKQYPEGGISEYFNYLESKFYPDFKSDSELSPIRKRFAETFAGFSTIQYFLELKDRNNDNIMIRNDGAIFHIDLAFLFNATPGGLNFQTAPFKFPNDYLTAMGGFESDIFIYYQSLMISNFSRLLINKEQLLFKIRILSAREEEIPCFKKFKGSEYQKKFPKSISKIKEKVQEVISDSFDNWRTRKYDDYQFKTNKILP